MSWRYWDLFFRFFLVFFFLEKVQVESSE